MEIHNAASRHTVHGLKPVVAATLCLALAGCATQGTQPNPFVEAFASQDPCSNNARNIGIAAGTILGAIIGNQIERSDRTRLIAAGMGATVGGLIGSDIDRQRCELHKIAQKHQITIESVSVGTDGKQVMTPEKSQAMGGISVLLPEPSGGESHFAVDSDQLTPKARSYFADIADAFNPEKVAAGFADAQARQQYLEASKRKKLFLVGHTDDTGSSQRNAELSERRARAVGQFLVERGMDKSRIFYQGAGEMYPLADNNTEAGRAANRRVELVEVENEDVFRNYLAKRAADPSRFRPTHIAQAASEPVGNTGLPSPDAQSTTAPNKQTVPPRAISLTTRSPQATTTRLPSMRVATAPGSTSPAIAASRAATATPAIDFGGQTYSESAAQIDVGGPIQKASFSFIKQAIANETAASFSCRLDRPRHVGDVKSLADGKSYKTTDKLAGLYGRTWRDMVGGHLVVINHLSVLRDGGQPANPPEVKVYKDYNPSRPNVKPSIVSTPQVNVYQGTHGTLIRTFFNGEGGLRCMDMLTPHAAPFVAKDGRLVYAKADGDYLTPFIPRMAE